MHLTMNSDKYSLTWQTYSDHLRTMMTELMMNEDYADVTLVTEDKKHIKAHMNILSACSPVFKDIMPKERRLNAIIYLKGIHFSEMEAIMQFIYLGEARLNEERMTEFIMVSKNLEIKELSNVIEMNHQSGSNAENIKLDNTDEDFDFIEDTTHFNKDGPIVEPQSQTKAVIPIKSVKRRVRRSETVPEIGKFKCQDCERSFNSRDNLTYHNKSKHEGVKYSCNQCDRQLASQGSLTIHIQSVHEGVKYACNQCDFQSGYQSNVTAHMKSLHEGVRYACNQCDHQATTQSHLTQHIQSVHEGLKYACNQCDQQFSRQSNLTFHIQSKHQGVKQA